MITVKNECYAYFRRFCSLSETEVSEITGISRRRILLIEHGEVVPTDEECNKLARLYNVTPEIINGSLSEVFGTIVREPIDASFYNNYIERDVIAEKITSLSISERTVIMKMRQVENKDEIYKKILEVLS